MPRIESSVDLPAPDGPMIEMTSPGCTSSVMRRSTYMRPAGVSNPFSRFRIEMRGPVSGSGSAASFDCVEEEKRPMKDSLSVPRTARTGLPAAERTRRPFIELPISKRAPPLLAAQRDEWVDARRAPCRYVAGHERDDGEQGGDEL